MNACPDCGTRDPDPIHVIRCAYIGLLLTSLLDYALTLDQPPSQPAITDLFAHARSIGDDASLAARWTRHVLDLGWRPTDFTAHDGDTP